jgi:hypothetical protein
MDVGDSEKMKEYYKRASHQLLEPQNGMGRFSALMKISCKETQRR